MWGSMSKKISSGWQWWLVGAIVLASSGIHFAQESAVTPIQARRDKILIEALLRLPKEEVKHDEKTNQLVQRFLKTTQDGAMFLKVMQHYQLEDSTELLWNFAISAKATDSTSVQAIEMCLNQNGKGVVEAWISANKANEKGHKTIEKLALASHPGLVELLAPLAVDSDATSGAAVAAGQGLTRTIAGQKVLIEQARENKLRGDVKTLVAGSLRQSNNAEVAKVAAELFPLPMSKDLKPLPSIEELAKRNGSTSRGEQLFRSVATCSNCHIVKGFGKNVGPDLSEIGSKLTREAMFVAVLDPSAGVSHNYESYVLQTDSGDVATGLLVSQTDEEIVLKDAQGIERKFAREEVEEFKKQEKSIMPENLHHNFDEQGLVDIVEYMLTLKKD